MNVAFHEVSSLSQVRPFVGDGGSIGRWIIARSDTLNRQNIARDQRSTRRHLSPPESNPVAFMIYCSFPTDHQRELSDSDSIYTLLESLWETFKPLDVTGFELLGNVLEALRPLPASSFSNLWPLGGIWSLFSFCIPRTKQLHLESVWFDSYQEWELGRWDLILIQNPIEFWFVVVAV